MSHEATNWAIKQRGIKPAAKVVLWHLCDRYHPDHGCFPSLDTLARDCEMSRRSVQNQIDLLVSSGLVAVEKMPREAGKLPRNRYRFSFESTPENLGQNLPRAKSALGKNERPPLANSDAHLGQNLPTNPVSEPVREPVSGKTRASAPEDGSLSLDLPPDPPAPQKKPKRAVSLPDAWVPSDKNVDDALKRGFSHEEINREADRFRDHHLARGTTFKDWDAAWRTWLGKSLEFADRRRPHFGSGPMAGKEHSSGRGQGSSIASIVARRRLDGEV